MNNSCMVLSFMDTLLGFVTYWKYFPTFSTVVIRACFHKLYAPFSLESKGSKRFGIITHLSHHPQIIQEFWVSLTRYDQISISTSTREYSSQKLYLSLFHSRGGDGGGVVVVVVVAVMAVVVVAVVVIVVVVE